MSQAESKMWDRRADEPNKWFARFHQYLLLGPSRSLYAAYAEDRAARGAEGREMRGGVPKSWREQAARWDWQTRAEAWDTFQRAEQLNAWVQRREDLREQEWKFSLELLDKARQMLVFPLAKTTRTAQGDGQTVVTEVHPARWSLADAGRLLETASRLGRLAVGDETERVGVNAKVIELTADDLARAARETAEWEKAMYGND